MASVSSPNFASNSAPGSCKKHLPVVCKGTCPQPKAHIVYQPRWCLLTILLAHDFACDLQSPSSAFYFRASLKTAAEPQLDLKPPNMLLFVGESGVITKLSASCCHIGSQCACCHMGAYGSVNAVRGGVMRSVCMHCQQACHILSSSSMQKNLRHASKVLCSIRCVPPW